MNEEKDFFKTCFNTVAGLDVKNESQAIAKEVVLSEIKNLQQENKQLTQNWNKLKEYIRETKLKEFEKSYGKRYGKTFTQAEIIVCNMILDKMQEIEKDKIYQEYKQDKLMDVSDFDKYYIQGSDHYLIPKDDFAELVEENQELKKQFGNKYEKVGTLTNEILYEENTKLINQQKEFMTFLEDNWKETQDIWYIKILNKYKEIIGCDK